MRQVDSLDLPGLEPYRTLRRPEAHFRQGIFVAEGEKLVVRLLNSDIDLVSLLVTPSWLVKLKATGYGAALETLDIFVAQDALLRQIAGFNIHQGEMLRQTDSLDVACAAEVFLFEASHLRRRS